MDEIPLEEVDPLELPEEFVPPKKSDGRKLNLISILFLTAIISLAAFFSLRSKLRPTIVDSQVGQVDGANVNLMVTELNGQLMKTLDEFAANMNQSVDPCDDFYQFACGSFAQRHPVSKGQREVTYLSLEFDLMKRRIMERLDNTSLLLSSIKPIKHVKYIWDSCTKGSPSDADQMDQLSNYLEQIDKLDSVRSQFIRLVQDGFEVFFAIKSAENGHNYQKLASIDRPNFPFAKAGTSGSLVDFYTQIVKLAKSNELDDEKSKQLALEVIEFERWLESNSTSQVERAKSPLGQLFSIKSLSDISHVNWTSLLDELIGGTYAPSKQVVVQDVAYLKNFKKVAKSKNRYFLNDYFKISAVHQSCFSIDKCRRMQLQILGPSYNNETESQYIRENCFNLLEQHFDDVLARVYHSLVKAYKSEAWQMIDRVVTEFEGAINELSWMDNTTRTEALDKLKWIKVNLDLPAVPDVSVMQMDYLDEPLINSSSRLDMFTYFRSTIKRRRSVDLAPLAQSARSRVKFPLLTPGPVFRQFQKLHVPDFLRQGHFYDVSYPSYLKLGSLGSLVAHEITHTFDAVANEFEDFYLHQRTTPYWTDETRKNFQAKMKCLVQAYEGENVEINGRSFGHKINGTSSLNENLADLFGLSVAYGRFKNSLSTNNNKFTTSGYPESLTKFTEEQMFFLSYANIHCSSDRGQVEADLDIGINSPHKYRVNVPLGQMNQFADAFACKVGTKMNPAEKCSFK